MNEKVLAQMEAGGPARRVTDAGAAAAAASSSAAVAPALPEKELRLVMAPEPAPLPVFPIGHCVHPSATWCPAQAFVGWLACSGVLPLSHTQALSHRFHDEQVFGLSECVASMLASPGDLAQLDDLVGPERQGRFVAILHQIASGSIPEGIQERLRPAPKAQARARKSRTMVVTDTNQVVATIHAVPTLSPSPSPTLAASANGAGADVAAVAASASSLSSPAAPAAADPLAASADAPTASRSRASTANVNNNGACRSPSVTSASLVDSNGARGGSVDSQMPSPLLRSKRQLHLDCSVVEEEAGTAVPAASASTTAPAAASAAAAGNSASSSATAAANAASSASAAPIASAPAVPVSTAAAAPARRPPPAPGGGRGSSGLPPSATGSFALPPSAYAATAAAPAPSPTPAPVAAPGPASTPATATAVAPAAAAAAVSLDPPVLDSGVLSERSIEWNTVVFDVIKINERGRKQPRSLRVTSQAVENIKDKDVTSRHPLSDVFCVSLTDAETLVISYADGAHDYTYQSPAAQSIAQEINLRLCKKRERVANILGMLPAASAASPAASAASAATPVAAASASAASSAGASAATPAATSTPPPSARHLAILSNLDRLSLQFQERLHASHRGGNSGGGNGGGRKIRAASERNSMGEGDLVLPADSLASSSPAQAALSTPASPAPAPQRSSIFDSPKSRNSASSMAVSNSGGGGGSNSGSGSGSLAAGAGVGGAAITAHRLQAALDGLLSDPLPGGATSAAPSGGPLCPDASRARARFLRHMPWLERAPETMLLIVRALLDQLRHFVEVRRVDEVRRAMGMHASGSLAGLALNCGPPPGFPSGDADEPGGLDFGARVERAVEGAVVLPAYPRLHSALRRICAPTDALLFGLIARLRKDVGTDQSFFGIPLWLQHSVPSGSGSGALPWAHAIEELNGMDHALLPMDKMHALCNTARAIYITHNAEVKIREAMADTNDAAASASASAASPSSTPSYLTSSAFLSVFCFVLVQSSLQCLDTSVQFLWGLGERAALNGVQGSVFCARARGKGRATHTHSRTRMQASATVKPAQRSSSPVCSWSVFILAHCCFVTLRLATTSVSSRPRASGSSARGPCSTGWSKRNKRPRSRPPLLQPPTPSLRPSLPLPRLLHLHPTPLLLLLLPLLCPEVLVCASSISQRNSARRPPLIRHSSSFLQLAILVSARWHLETNCESISVFLNVLDEIRCVRWCCVPCAREGGTGTGRQCTTRDELEVDRRTEKKDRERSMRVQWGEGERLLRCSCCL